ncbi:hypothetical protein KUCAC02_026179 [Chaenocephalus aceratus]|uniref:Uncharacterized protein n=1 Tax=Chaenocephalus aceratus TaxID=36190 RepID=A0ACB9VWR7_CHAAC|nr:hypothetical protein KUCAC02_026179 [Chaenocephalus aceratus]
MTGRLNGVAKQLTDDIPWLVAVACAAHRLALAVRGPQRRANRSAALRNAATTLSLSDLKVKEVKDTRWLSQEMAIQNRGGTCQPSYCSC